MSGNCHHQEIKDSKKLKKSVILLLVLIGFLVVWLVGFLVAAVGFLVVCNYLGLIESPHTM